MLVDMDRPILRGTAVTGPAVRERWLIGVPFRPDAARVVWMYYVVDEARDDAQAVRVAMERANSAQERRVRGGVPVVTEGIEVRRIRLDALGHTILDGCW
ncbi:hypothetical protein [Streptomyces phaeoluteigriseus]